jgi:hypothetical protein
LFTDQNDRCLVEFFLWSPGGRSIAGAAADSLCTWLAILAAIAEFKRAIPEMDEVILWGGCNAASGIMINAYRYPEVTGMIISNPFAHTEATQAATVRKHYIRRLRDPTFWIKVFKLRFNPLPYLRTGLKRVVRKVLPQQPDASGSKSGQHGLYIERMLSGLKRFRGDILLIMSGQSLTSEEFDVLVANSVDWQKAYKSALIRREDIKIADQAFSTPEARNELISKSRDWLVTLRRT